MTVDPVVGHVVKLMDMEDVLSPGRYKKLVQTRSLVCYWAVWEANIREAELSRFFAITQPAVILVVNRGRDISNERDLKFQ